MYIISKFHDYYDSIMKQELDKQIIYQRNKESIDNVSHKLKIYHYYQNFIKKTVQGYCYLPDLDKDSRHTYSYITVNTGLLGFCGKQYLVLICQYKNIYLTSCIYNRWLIKLKQTQLLDYKNNIYNFN